MKYFPNQLCLSVVDDQFSLIIKIIPKAFYLFPSIEKFGMDSAAFCTRMIHEAGLAATPGFCFGSDRHIRLTYCYSDEELAEGLNRLEKFVRSL